MGMIINPYMFAAAGTPDVTDNFNRTDSTTTLGTASDGIHPWTAHVGTWGINTNQAYCPTLSGGLGHATCDYGARDCTTQVTFATVARPMGMAVGYADSNNYLRIRIRIIATVHRIEIHTVIAGVFVQLTSADGTTWVDTDIMKVILGPGNSVDVHRNGASLISSTDAGLASIIGTRHGLYTESTSSRFDDFSIVA